MQDKRSCARWQVGHQAGIKLEGAQAFADCRVCDINFKGVQVSLKLKLPEDCFFNFQLMLSEDICLKVEAWVAWHKPAEGRHIYGLYFTQVEDCEKEKIYKFVYHKVPSEISQKWWEGQEEQPAKKLEDKRVFQRFNIRQAVKYLDIGRNVEREAQTRDISAKGIGLWSDQPLEPRTQLELWLHMPDKGEPVYTRGKVVWSAPEAEGGYRLGVSLDKADLMALSRILRP